MFETPGKKGRGDLVTLNVTWDVVSKGADVVGIISLGISLVTLLNTRKIRSSMIFRFMTIGCSAFLKASFQENTDWILHRHLMKEL